MLSKKPMEVLIAPEEAVRLSRRYGTWDVMNLARRIAEAWKDTDFGHSPLWATCGLYDCLFEAGRIQGIREERRRRRV